MQATYENYGQVTALSLKGEFGGDDVDAFNKVAGDRLAANVRDFVIDLEKVTFVDSAALEALLDFRDKVQENLGMLKLACPDPNVAKILEITRLDQQFEIYPDLIEAIKTFR